MDNSSGMEKPVPAEQLAENNELLLKFFKDYTNLIAPDFNEGKRDEIELSLGGGIGDQVNSKLTFSAYRERRNADEDSPEDEVLYILQRMESEDTTDLPEELVEQLDYEIESHTGVDNSDHPESPKKITAYLLFLNDRELRSHFRIKTKYEYRGFPVILEQKTESAPKLSAELNKKFESLIIEAELEWRRRETAKLLGYMAGVRPPET